MTDFIVLAVVAAIVALAGSYVYRAKKKGQKCIGCPNGCACGKEGGSSCTGCADKKMQ